ncbi:LysR substrate-binding domain-containing protein [Rhodoferax aquaticus]|uniref:LysR family transcriptional regulator n=1 Tax=Rhodoferax aquaticus TaxID=2527691 RepID=A0A515EUB1_9BURK|nr:LysR substrate-binding domain-containing protein [Rhodoferax aquaticus]QDL56267.1 LysR family transcriptional regulator [Rhodoferax aquaticus]
MQDLNDMLYFAEVVERGGFAAAGRALGVPKSKLSRRVAELEARLGLRLLQRTTRKLSLTQVGEVYHRHCVAMRDEAAAAEQAVAEAQTEPRGLLRIACPVTLAQSTLGVLLPAYMARYPLVKVDMRVSNRAVDLVEEGFDVALRVRPTLDDSGSLVIKSFGQSKTLLVCSPQQIERQGQPTDLASLQTLDTISMSASDGRMTWHLIGPGGATHEFVHYPRYIADDLHTLKLAVLQGLGMCFMPDYMCTQELAQGQLQEALPGWAPRPGLFHAVFPSRRGMVPTVRTFLDFLASHIAREGQPTPPNTGPDTVQPPYGGGV